jgi:hypothetical protein
VSKAVAAALASAAIMAGPLPAASAAPPPNDSPASPGAFAPYTAANGTPRDLQAIAELAEATADPGVPRCLGDLSFSRTVWFLIPATDAPQELTVEASGQTLDVVDLAAFVQPAAPAGPLSAIPNACSGAGAGGSDATEEPTSAVTLRVPAGRSVLIQAGRRGPIGSPSDERALLSLDTRPLAFTAAPAGDTADLTAPYANAAGPAAVPIANATITEEDPATPPCPSLGTVWRRILPLARGYQLISATGHDLSTLAVFAGHPPSIDNAVDCVNREQGGALQMRVPTRPRQPLWIRLGTDRPAAVSEAVLTLRPGESALVIDGGPGGSDPTPGGPGGGFPADCARSKVELAQIGGPRFGGTATTLNRRPVVGVRLAIQRGPVCDVELELVGPRSRVYATTRAISLKGRPLVRLQRIRTLARGGYRLRVSAVSQLGERLRVKSVLRGVLK